MAGVGGVCSGRQGDFVALKEAICIVSREGKGNSARADHYRVVEGQFPRVA